MYSFSLLAPVIFTGVWAIEALTIKNKLGGTPQKALFTALVVNLATSLSGFVLVKKNFLAEYTLYNESLTLMIFFLLSVFVEMLMLHFCYREESWHKVIIASFLMNLKSYFFLAFFLIGDFTIIGGAIILVIVVPYFFTKAFRMLAPDREFLKFFKIRSGILIHFLSIVLIGLVFIGTIKAIDKAFLKQRREVIKEHEVMSNMLQISSKAELIYAYKGSYESLNCDYDEEIKSACKNIEKKTGARLTIHTSENRYCAYIKLIYSEKWYCADNISGLIPGKININPSILGYCDGKTFICP